MGKDIDPDELLIVPRSVLQNIPKEFRDAIDRWGGKARKQLKDRKGLKLVKA